MAMPGSGSIGIITCPNSVACTSISQAVDGNVTPPKSLCALSVTAGKSAPHGMTEFYGYNPTPKAVSYSIISCSAANDTSYWSSNIISTAALSSGECYTPSIRWCIISTTGKINAYVRLYCGTTQMCVCSLSNGTYNCSGTWTADVKYSDAACWIVCTYSRTIAGFGGCACACLCICAVTNGVGSFTVGTPICIYSCSCDTFA